MTLSSVEEAVVEALVKVKSKIHPDVNHPRGRIHRRETHLARTRQDNKILHAEIRPDKTLRDKIRLGSKTHLDATLRDRTRLARIHPIVVAIRNVKTRLTAVEAIRHDVAVAIEIVAAPLQAARKTVVSPIGTTSRTMAGAVMETVTARATAG